MPAASHNLRILSMLCCAILAAPAARAHLPELFGRKYVLEAEASQVAPAEPQRSRDEDRDLVRELEEQLDAREGGQGVYSVGLSDPLFELAKVYARLGNHPAALDDLRRALQLQRINEGLLHRSQLPILRALADSYAGIGDTRSAQLSWRYAFRVHGMGRGELDELALGDSLRYFQTARDIFVDPRGFGDVRLFFQAFQDNQAMVEAQLEREESSFDTVLAVGISQLYNLYLLMGIDLSMGLKQGGEGAGSAAYDYILRTQDLAYSKGRELLETLLQRVPEGADETRSELQLRLANWHMWNTKWMVACRLYAEVWAAGGALRERLAQPAALPEDPQLWRSLQGPDIPVRAIVQASFRVSTRGDVRGVDATLLSESDAPFAGRISRMLRDSHFRPAIGDEGCVAGRLENQRYRLIDY